MRRVLTPVKRLGISILLGLMAAGSVWVFLQTKERQLENRFRMTTVLTAKKYIAAGKLVSSDQVEESRIPQAFLAPTALQRKKDLKDSQGADHLQARIGLLPGEQVTRSKTLEKESALGLSWNIPVGQACLSLRLSREQAVAGLIQPGDWVHVFCTLRRGSGVAIDQSRLVLDHVRILAVQDKIWEAGPPIDKEGSEKLSGDTLLVTFLLTPLEIATLNLSSEKGKIALALASPLETASLPETVSDLKNLVSINHK